MIHRHRGNRRKQNYRKAIRKEKIAKQVYHFEDGHNYYNHLNQFSKNKIHCSCPMCKEKTNQKFNKSRGPVSHFEKHFSDDKIYTIIKGSRIPRTNKRYGKKNYKHSDHIKIDRMVDQYKEYLNNEDTCLSQIG